MTEDPSIQDTQNSNHEESMPTQEQTNVIDTKQQKVTVMEIISKNLDQVQVKKRKHQMVGFNQIKLITKILHMQKKELGLSMTGDQVIEKQIKKNYIDQIYQLIKQGYSITNENDNSTPFAILQKTVRRIEQEEKVPSESVDQIFQERAQQQPAPYDFFEQQFLLSQGRMIPEVQAPTFKDQIQAAEQKLMQMNKYYEHLKQRQFQFRRGRNNRIFMKSMMKTIYDYDTDESSHEEPVVNCKKRSFEQCDYLERSLLAHKTVIEDIQKNCRNKRLKKNLFKVDLQKLGSKFQEPPNHFAPYSDSVIDNQFKMFNKESYDNLMRDHAEQQLIKHNMNKNLIYEGDSNHIQKLKDFDEYLLTQNKLPSVSPTIVNQKLVMINLNTNSLMLGLD